MKICNIQGELIFDGDDLKGADLRGANLEGADLRWANLEGANLGGANLKGAKLETANLVKADLEGAYLKGANLDCADLEEANLERANLNGVSLEGAYLKGANLKRANLEGAYLKNIEGKKILTFSAGKHFAYYCDGYIRIGCFSLKVKSWLNEYRDIGKDYGYNDEEIELYGNFIKMCAKLNKKVKGNEQ